MQGGHREIAGKTFQDKADAKISKSFSKFLIKLAELCPRLVLKQIALLQKHLDSEVGHDQLSALPCSSHSLAVLSNP
jgi:hypothetical protein